MPVIIVDPKTHQPIQDLPAGEYTLKPNDDGTFSAYPVEPQPEQQPA